MGLFSKGKNSMGGSRNNFLTGTGKALVALDNARTIKNRNDQDQTFVNFKVLAREPGSNVVLGTSYAYGYNPATAKFGDSAAAGMAKCVLGFAGIRSDTFEHILEGLTDEKGVKLSTKFDLEDKKARAIAEVEVDDGVDALFAEMTAGEGEAWKGRVAEVTFRQKPGINPETNKPYFTSIYFEAIPPGMAKDGVLTKTGIAHAKSQEWDIQG